MAFIVLTGGCGGGGGGGRSSIDDPVIDDPVTGSDASVFDGSWTCGNLKFTDTDTGSVYDTTGILTLTPNGDSGNIAYKDFLLDVYQGGTYIDSIEVDDVPFEVSSNSSEIQLLLSGGSVGYVKMTYYYGSRQLNLSIQVTGAKVNGTFSKSGSSEYSADAESPSQYEKEIRNLITVLKENF
jgi:hypothetical protein